MVYLRFILWIKCALQHALKRKGLKIPQIGKNIGVLMQHTCQPTTNSLLRAVSALSGFCFTFRMWHFLSEGLRKSRETELMYILLSCTFLCEASRISSHYVVLQSAVGLMLFCAKPSKMCDHTAQFRGSLLLCVRV